MQNSYEAVFFARTVISTVALALFLIIACSAQSIWRISRRFIPTQKLQPLSQRYEDEDGTATLESEAAYSYQLQRVLVVWLSIIGSLDSLIFCVITTQRLSATVGVEQWLQFGAWVHFDLIPRQKPVH